VASPTGLGIQSCAQAGCVPAGVGDCDEDDAARVKRLTKEKEALQQRLDFIEEIVGPTEAQRKILQDQVLEARSAAIRAKCRGARVPVKVAGRLDKHLLWESGMSERDAGLLQGGCLPDQDGILQDVSLLGDPQFRPYNESTGEPRWHARGGMLKLSLDEVRNRFGSEIAQDVVRCAQELDKYDASRRVGIELPWHPIEDRELQPSEVIDLLDRELELTLRMGLKAAEDRSGAAAARLAEHMSPYSAVHAPPRRCRARREHERTPQGRGDGASLHAGLTAPSGVQRRKRVAGGSGSGGAVVHLPRVEGPRRAAHPEGGGAASSRPPQIPGSCGRLRPGTRDNSFGGSSFTCALDRSSRFI